MSVKMARRRNFHCERDRVDSVGSSRNSANEPTCIAMIHHLDESTFYKKNLKCKRNAIPNRLHTICSRLSKFNENCPHRTGV